MNNFSIVIKGILFLSLYCSVIFSQTDGPRNMPDRLTNPGWEFYSDNTLSAISAGKGFSGIASLGDLSALNLNPAAINVEKKFQVYIGGAVKSEVNLQKTYDFTPYLSNYFPSGILGGIYKINKNIQTGIIYRNEYSYKFKFENSANPSYNIDYSFITHNFTFPFIYNYKWLRTALNLNIIYFRGETKGLISTETNPEGSYDEIHSSLWRIVPQIGIFINPIKNISFGMCYTPGFSDSTKWIYNNSQPSEEYNSVKYPWRLGIGTEVKLLDEKLRLTFDYQFSNTAININSKNKSNFHFGAEYELKKDILLRGGFFTLLDFRDLSGQIIVEDENTSYDQYFITIGGTYKYRGYSFSLALMDSHLTKKTDVYHTKIVGGVSLDL